MHPFAATGSIPVNLAKIGYGSGATSVTIPACQAGDLGIIINSSISSTSPGSPPSYASVPSGWSEIGRANSVSGSGDGQAVQVWAKILALADSGASVSGMNSTSETLGCFVFRGDHPLTALAYGDFDSQFTSGDPAAQTISAAGIAPYTATMLWGVNGHRSTESSVLTLTPTADEIKYHSDSRAGYAYYFCEDNNAVDGSADCVDAGTSTFLASFYVSVQ